MFLNLYAVAYIGTHKILEDLNENFLTGML